MGVLEPYIKQLAEQLPVIDNLGLYDLVIQTKELPNGDFLVGATYVQKPLDQINLGCEGC